MFTHVEIVPVRISVLLTWFSLLLANINRLIYYVA